VLETGPSVVEEEPTMMLKRDDMASEETVEASREARKEGRKGREGKALPPPQQPKESGKLSGEKREKESFRLSVCHSTLVI
jgi:hypothetical protein